MKRPGTHFLVQFLDCRRAAVLIEFAFIIPVMILLFAGIVEISRFILIQEKVVNTSSSLAQYVSQRLNPTDPGDLQNAYHSLIEPFDETKGCFIVSSVTRPGGVGAALVVQPVQDKCGGKGGSKINQPGGPKLSDLNPVFLPTASNPSGNDQLIIVETFYNYKSIIPGARNFSQALNVDSNIYKFSEVLRRNNTPVLEGTEVTPPKPFGCCGEYCKDEDQPEGVKCTPCKPNLQQECAITQEFAKLYHIPLCEMCSPTAPSKPCVPGDTRCKCDKANCKHKGG